MPPHTVSSSQGPKVCPECGHLFQGNGWDGIDAHWKAKHEKIMPYAKAWPLLSAGHYEAQPITTPDGRKVPLERAIETEEAAAQKLDAEDVAEKKRRQDTARYETVALEHGADLSEEGFTAALKKVARHKPS